MNDIKAFANKPRRNTAVTAGGNAEFRVSKVRKPCAKEVAHKAMTTMLNQCSQKPTSKMGVGEDSLPELEVSKEK